MASGVRFTIKREWKRGIGYIPTSVLENTAAEEKTEESKVAKVDGEEAGTIHKSEGKGVLQRLWMV